MHAIKNFVTNMIARCRVSRSGGDGGQFPVNQISYYDKTSECEVITPYGLYSNPPVNSLGILFHSEGQEQNRAGIFNVTGTRFKNLKEGEVVTGNTVSLSNIKFDSDGNVIITVKNNLEIVVDADNNITIQGAYNLTSVGNANIEAPTINLTGNVVISGTLTANNGAITMNAGNFNTTGTITATVDVVGNGTSLHTHVHSGVTPGGSNTGGPV